MSLDAASALLDHADATAAGLVQRCAACDYDLRGLTENRCPECGLRFDPNFLPSADIPWLRRDGNALPAYVRTVALMLLRPRRVGQMVWQDVDVAASEATAFRWITIGIATGSTLAVMVPLVGTMRAWVVPPLLGLPVITFFWMATARFNVIQFAPARFADEQRYRRLHELTCAGLGLAPVVPGIMMAGVVLGWPSDRIALMTFCAAWAVLGAWWFGSLCFQMHGGRCTFGDALLHALLVPFAWLLIAIVIAVFALGVMGLLLSIFG
jgi:hypothetical protein